MRNAGLRLVWRGRIGVCSGISGVLRVEYPLIGGINRSPLLVSTLAIHHSLIRIGPADYGIMVGDRGRGPGATRQE